MSHLIALIALLAFSAAYRGTVAASSCEVSVPDCLPVCYDENRTDCQLVKPVVAEYVYPEFETGPPLGAVGTGVYR